MFVFFNPVPVFFFSSPYVNGKYTFEWTPIGYIKNKVKEKKDDEW